MALNVAMATWPGNRIVRNRKRAILLKKRRELIRWNAEKQYWEWTPCAAWERRFVCPFCKGRHWGTNRVKHPVFDYQGNRSFEIISLGGCHTPNCDFSWDRDHDDDFFVWERKQFKTMFNTKRIAA